MSGFKFRRQYPCGPFILDFYCPAALLAIELDGGGHAAEEQALQDQARTQWIASDKIRIVRFWNHDVLERPERVLESILRELAQVQDPHPDPLPEGEGTPAQQQAEG